MLKKIAKMLAALFIGFFILMAILGVGAIIAWTKGLAILLVVFIGIVVVVYRQL